MKYKRLNLLIHCIENNHTFHYTNNVFFIEHTAKNQKLNLWVKLEYLILCARARHDKVHGGVHVEINTLFFTAEIIFN